MKIDIQKIVAKHNQMFWLERTPESLPMIKEIVEAVIIVCKEEARLERISDSRPGKVVKCDAGFGQVCISGNWAGEYIRINKDSILNVKKQIKYD